MASKNLYIGLTGPESNIGLLKWINENALYVLSRKVVQPAAQQLERVQCDEYEMDVSRRNLFQPAPQYTKIDVNVLGAETGPETMSLLTLVVLLTGIPGFAVSCPTLSNLLLGKNPMWRITLGGLCYGLARK